jgi:GNAT superfamily N-acetyltransferase
MSSEAENLYLDTAHRRADAARGSGASAINGPGLIGVQRPDGRLSLTVVDDRGVPQLTGILESRPAGSISVLAAAELARQLIEARGGWRAQRLTAMVCADLERVPEVALPPSLALRSVSFGDDEGPGPTDERPDAISLLAACAVAVGADPGLEGESPEGLARYLRMMNPLPTLLAGTDSAGTPVATSGYRVSGTEASIMFVNTAREWRRRGIGQAMTAAALHAARRAGATSATLDATADGASIYRRLGFESAGMLTQFSTRG